MRSKVENSTTPTLKRILGAFAAGLFVLAQASVALAQTATLVPNARQQFFNSNGQPLAGGSATFYVPNTTTPKSTWLDENEGTLNANPVTLDSGGFATIFGQGNYREVVKDSLGNLIFDGFTTASGSSSPAGATGSDTAPVGTILPWAGFNFNVPTNWALAYGQALSRTTYAQLEAAITISTTTGNCTATSTTISGFTDTSQIAIGSPLESSCLPTGTTVASVTNGTTLVASQAATATGSFTVTAFPWGNGDGVTTFNVPDLRGRVLPGADAMGGTAASRLTSAYYGASAAPPAVSGGLQNHTASTTLAQTNLPNVNFTVSGITLGNNSLLLGGASVNGGCNNAITGHCAGGSAAAYMYSSQASVIDTTATSNVTVTAQGTAASGGSGTAAVSANFATIQPSVTMDYIIKIAPNTTGAGGVVSANGLFGDVLWTAGTGMSVTTSSPNITYSCIPALASVIGCVKPDGVTTTVNSSGTLTAIGAATTSIDAGGATSISNGLAGDILYDNAGKVGHETLLPLANGGLGGSQAAATANQVPMFPGGGGAAVPTTIRTPLAAATTYYVNGASGTTAICGPTGALTCQPGSDSNNGLSNSAPFLTLQHAINVINAGVDQFGFSATVNLAHAAAGSAAAANYSVTCANGPFVGGVEVIVEGDTTSQSAVNITAPNGGTGVFVKDQCVLHLTALQINDAGTAANLIHVGQVGVVDVSSVNFGSCNSSADQIYAESGGVLNFTDSLSSIVGGCGHFADAQNGGEINFVAQTVAIPSAVAYTDFAIAINGRLWGLGSGTFTGAGVAATTGIRAQLTGSSFMSSGGVACNTVFPGNSPCQFISGSNDDAGDGNPTRATAHPTGFNPVGTASTTPVMAGAAGSFTPKTSGNVLFMAQMSGSNSTSGDGCSGLLSYGTGTAPANGAAATGTGAGATQVSISPSANALEPMTIFGYVTGLTVGTAYWFDVRQAAQTGGTCSFSDMSLVALEQ